MVLARRRLPHCLIAITMEQPGGLKSEGLTAKVLFTDRHLVKILRPSEWRGNSGSIFDHGSTIYGNGRCCKCPNDCRDRLSFARNRSVGSTPIQISRSSTTDSTRAKILRQRRRRRSHGYGDSFSFGAKPTCSVYRLSFPWRGAVCSADSPSEEESGSRYSDEVRPGFAMAPIRKRPFLPTRELQLQLKQELPRRSRTKSQQPRAGIAISTLALS